MNIYKICAIFQLVITAQILYDISGTPSRMLQIQRMRGYIAAI